MTVSVATFNAAAQWACGVLICGGVGGGESLRRFDFQGASLRTSAVSAVNTSRSHAICSRSAAPR